MTIEAVDAVSSSIAAAVEKHVSVRSFTHMRLRYFRDFLAYPGRNGKTLTGRVAAGMHPPPDAPVELLYITTRWFGIYIVKHYCTIRHFTQASTVAWDFLTFLRDEGSLPASMAKELDAAIKIADLGVEQLPRINRLTRQPCARNEAYSKVYPLRPFPLCTVPPSAKVKDSSSRHWPATLDQVDRTWLRFTSERCRVEPEELEAIVEAVPKKLTIEGKVEGKWEVVSVNPDSSVTFRRYKPMNGHNQQYTIPFSKKRAADFMPGMVMIATFVTLSDGTQFATDTGYVFPTYYVPVVGQALEYGAAGLVHLVF